MGQGTQDEYRSPGAGHEAAEAALAAGQSPAPPRRRLLGLSAGTLVQLAFLAAALLPLVFFDRLSDLRQRQVHEITRVFLGTFLEAMPFMLIGSLVGGLIEVFVSPDRVLSLVSRGRRRSVLLAAGLGLVFPVCECAIVPVVRRLVRKGAPLSAAVAFLLAGPIVNPIAAASTLVAYGGKWQMMAVRLGVGYLVAVVIGLVAGRIFDARQALVAGSRPPEPGQDHADGQDHDHQHEHGRDQAHDGGQACCAGAGAAAGVKAAGLGGRLMDALAHAAGDFLDVGRYLVIGAFIAAVLRTLLRQEHIVAYGRDPFLSLLPMMGLAFVLNLCSEADAFVAASLRDLVSFGGQLAFLVLGPMLDIKLVVMYLGLFRKRAIAVLVLLIVVGVFVAVLFCSFPAEVSALWVP